MRNILLKLEYDGSGFHGWQYQPEVRTVQGVLEDVLSEVLGSKISVNGTSRTDAGVHALGQHCSFVTDNPIPTEGLKKALNNSLSAGKTIAGTIAGDIRILDCIEVPDDFHARFSCKGKTYEYLLSTDEPDSFRGRYCYFINGKLDLDAMRNAASYIVGTHDFACFQAAGGTSRETTVRTISELDIADDLGDESAVSIKVTGDGFLYNMVRIIVGTLVEVGQGRRSPESIKDIIDSCDRTQAGHTAPAEGLYLKEVYFE